MYPCIEIDLEKIKYNYKTIKRICQDIKIAGVIKVFCGSPIIAQTLVDVGIDYLADSRIQNLEKVKDIKAEKIMLRLPSPSESDLVVQFADISLNSELFTIKQLSESAKKYGKTHKIILMVDLGDLREGIFEESKLFNLIEEVRSLENIKIEGLGTNLTCFGAIVPKYNNLKRLVDLKEEIEKRFPINLNILSGGNSSSIYLAQNNEMPHGINNLRLGEAIYFGREAAYLNNIPDTFDDAVILKAEIIEIKKKPSVPIGETSYNAFGETPVFEDKGIITRAICAVGRQDVDSESLTPLDSSISILGCSSDHLLLHLPSNSEYSVGDIVSFKLPYTGVLKAMTSEYLEKVYKNNGAKQ